MTIDLEAAGDAELKWTTSNFQSKREAFGDSVSQAGGQGKIFTQVKPGHGLNKEKLSQLGGSNNDVGSKLKSQISVFSKVSSKIAPSGISQ